MMKIIIAAGRNSPPEKCPGNRRRPGATRRTPSPTAPAPRSRRAGQPSNTPRPNSPRSASPQCQGPAPKRRTPGIYPHRWQIRSSSLLLRGLAGFFAFRGFFGLRLVAFLAQAAAALARTAAAAAGFAEGLAQHSKESLFRLLFVFHIIVLH